MEPLCVCFLVESYAHSQFIKTAEGGSHSSRRLGPGWALTLAPLSQGCPGLLCGTRKPPKLGLKVGDLDQRCQTCLHIRITWGIFPLFLFAFFQHFIVKILKLTEKLRDSRYTPVSLLLKFCNCHTHILITYMCISLSLCQSNAESTWTQSVYPRGRFIYLFIF